MFRSEVQGYEPRRFLCVGGPIHGKSVALAGYRLEVPIHKPPAADMDITAGPDTRVNVWAEVYTVRRVAITRGENAPELVFVVLAPEWMDDAEVKRLIFTLPLRDVIASGT